MMEHYLKQIALYSSEIIELLGVLLVLFGGLKAIVTVFKKEFTKDQSKKHTLFVKMRRELGHDLILALEFFLAGDIIKTVTSPTLWQLGILSALILIRTTLNFLLTREIKEI